MARRKSTATKSNQPIRQQPAGTSAPAGGWFTARAIRETVESVVVAFILAFLFRTFEAEAFVIPTGSMAPTLTGAHKDLYCPECGYQYRGGASSEEDQFAQQRGRSGTGEPVVSVTCPMCRFAANVGPGHDHPTYGGDRILVSKFAYEFGEPERWDVVVFKFPAESQTNYIKRCVGLPGETLRIWHGDLYAKPPGGDRFAVTRRKPRELRAMAHIVYDNDYVVESMTKAGWPLRWQGWPQDAAAADAWKSDDGGVSYSIPGGAKGIQWLRYRHFAPSIYDWQAMRRGSVGRDEPKPQLITDFYAYDTSIQRGKPKDLAHILGLHWVGDLLVECELESADGKGKALLDLIKGGRHFRCEIDCETGEATLSIDGLPNFGPKAQTGARGAGSHHVAFANIDRQLVLWVDDSPVTFDGPTDYEPLGNDIPQSTPDDPLDLAPARIGSQSAALSVNHIRLWRDMYYIAARQADGAPSDYTGQGRQIAAMSYQQLLQFLSTPGQWAPPGVPSPFDERRDAIFALEEDQFFMLGDNSPMSLDARLWSDEKFVSRELLIGRALLIFWPHSFNRIPGTNIPFPFFPNFARMGFIR